MKISVVLFLLSLAFALKSQVSGVIKDKETKRGIPFVNIQSKESRKGTNSDQSGKFRLKLSETDTLVFSAIGFQTKMVPVKKMAEHIYLQAISYALPEVPVNGQTMEYVIGRVKKQIFSYGSSALKDYPYMIGRYFKYQEDFSQYPYLKSIEVLTDSDIDSALFNVRLYIADSLGFPAEQLVNKNLLVHAAKGYEFTQIDVEKQYLKFPHSGLFVAVEWLVLEENEYTLTYRDSRTKKKVETTYLAPKFALDNDRGEGDYYTYYMGKWKKHKEKDQRMIQMKIVLRN